MTEIEQAMASLKHLVECRCDEAYTGRDRHDPHSACDYADEVKIVADHIEALNAKLAKAAYALRLVVTAKGLTDPIEHGYETIVFARAVLSELEKTK